MNVYRSNIYLQTCANCFENRKHASCDCIMKFIFWSTACMRNPKLSLFTCLIWDQLITLQFCSRRAQVVVSLVSVTSSFARVELLWYFEHLMRAVSRRCLWPAGFHHDQTVLCAVVVFLPVTSSQVKLHQVRFSYLGLQTAGPQPQGDNTALRKRLHAHRTAWDNWASHDLRTRNNWNPKAYFTHFAKTSFLIKKTDANVCSNKGQFT